LAYQSLVGLYYEFFGIPHMTAVVKLIGSRSLPWIIRALLDHIATKVSSYKSHFSFLEKVAKIFTLRGTVQFSPSFHSFQFLLRFFSHQLLSTWFTHIFP